MACAAVVRQAELQVAWIVRGSVFRAVAGIAGRRSSRVDVVEVAGGAGQRCVHTGERKSGYLQVVKRSAKPAIHRVASLAGCGQFCAEVIEYRGQVVLLVAGEARSG